MGIGREGNVESHSRTPLVHGCRLSVTHAISKLKESFGGILFQAKYSQLRQPIFADKPTFLEQACSTETGMSKGTLGGGKCITTMPRHIRIVPTSFLQSSPGSFFQPLLYCM